MTKEQVELIYTLLAAQQTAIVHLSTIVARRSGISKEDMANSFRRTADLLSDGVNDREIITMVLNHIATGIDSSTPDNAH